MSYINQQILWIQEYYDKWSLPLEKYNKTGGGGENTENERYQLQACSVERELKRGELDQKDFLIHEAQKTGRVQQVMLQQKAFQASTHMPANAENRPEVSSSFRKFMAGRRPCQQKEPFRRCKDKLRHEDPVSKGPEGIQHRAAWARCRSRENKWVLTEINML